MYDLYNQVNLLSTTLFLTSKKMYISTVIIGTRIGQASECFVYWKDPMTNDTWGLNFTSPIDAKQFRECCVSIIIDIPPPLLFSL